MRLRLLPLQTAKALTLMNENNIDGVIKISKEEATSSHVDDMLKRQMSLRGESGVVREYKRVWYLQNWFVFGVVGLLGAISAWAILEPFFDDTLYIQGPITAIDRSIDSLAPEDSDEVLQLRSLVLGSIRVNGERIIIPAGAKELAPDGSKPRIKLGTLKEGEMVGVYVERSRGRGGAVAVCDFIERTPKPLPPSRAKLTLAQLESRVSAAGLLLFPLVAGLIGLFIGAADGLVCRLPRRALLGGAVGLIVGFVGGFVSSILAEIAYAPLHQLAMKQTGNGGLGSFGFILQTMGRAMAWCLAGVAMGLGQGIALRSKRLLLYGLLGGVVGGLLGGLLFDPIDLILLGSDKPSAHWSRLIGFGVIGLSVGAMIGIVELLARDAWLRMTQGPLTGKEFLLFKDVMKVGASPRSDIYLFNDSLVAAEHATIRAVGDEAEIEALASTHPIVLNNRTVQRARLRHGDSVTIGRTIFVFQRRKG